jgi:hypothetical protein
MTDKTPKRVVPVTVDVTPGADGSVDITCSPNPANIIEGSSNVLLVFTLATAGYRFRTAKTIELDVPVDDFPFASWTINDTMAALYDRNKVADVLKYTVHVVDIKTGVEYSVDPEIKNGGGGTGTCDA